MLRVKNILTVLDDDNGSFSDHSNKAVDYDRDTFTVTLDAATSYLYIGFYKPINIFFAEIDTVNINAGTMGGEFYNGTTWVNLDGLYDETSAFARSGFVQWDRNQVSEAATTINSVEKFWYRFRTTSTTSAITFKGINIVFADDNDLKREYFEILEFLPTGQASHILTHVAARDEIIQYLRNSGGFTQSNTTGQLNDLTSFDLLDIGQIKLAATYLALSKIFLSVQDQTDDVHLEKSRHFRSLYNSAIKTFYLDIDQDDDGLDDESERLASSTGRLLRR